MKRVIDKLIIAVTQTIDDAAERLGVTRNTVYLRQNQEPLQMKCGREVDEAFRLMREVGSAVGRQERLKRTEEKIEASLLSKIKI